MNSNPEENRLQALFAELKQQDQRLAPSFERVLSAAVRRKRQPIAARIGYAGYIAAAALVIVAVTVGMLSQRPAGQPSVAVKLPDRSNAAPIAEPPAMPLSSWQSPTAFLLQASDEWGQLAGVPDDTAFPATQPQFKDPT